MGDRGEQIERHVKAGRTTKSDARAGDTGKEAPAPSYTEDSGVSDLGVDEPVLPDPAPDAAPTGMYAGETEADRQQEDDLRRTLEERFPRTEGDWKESGAVPDDDRDDA